MLYLTLNDQYIEVINSQKILIGEEKIISVKRQEIPVGLLKDGLILDKDKFKLHIQTLLKEISIPLDKNHQLVLSVSDKLVFTKRFLMEKTDKSKLASTIIDRVKLELPYDTTELENFYKILNLTTEDKEDILFTAMTKSSVLHFAEFFKSLNLTLNFISASSFAFFEFLNPLLDLDGKQKLFLDIGKKNSTVYLFDHFGPLLVKDIVYHKKDTTVNLKELLSSFKKENDFDINKIIIGGEGSLEIPKSDFENQIQLPTLKITEVFDDILKKHKLTFDTDGISKSIYAQILGLVILAKNKSAPNFARDLSMLKDHKAKPEQILPITETSDEKSTLTDENETLQEKPDKDNVMISQPIMEYHKSFMSSLLGNKIVLFFTGLIVFVIMFILVNNITKGSLSNSITSIISKPTMTPTPTLEPTMTPIPTINPNIKREDLKLSVQNGTEISGYASKIASVLEEKGFKNVAKSNADKNDYQKNELRIKDDKKDFVEIIRADLKDNLTSFEVKSLSSDDKFDCILILGSEEAPKEEE